MSLLAYAITDAPGLDAPRPAGIDGAPVHAISAGPLTAVVQEVETVPLPAPEALWTYEQVIESLMSRATVLPVRYGTLLGDEAAVRRMLEARRGPYLASLDRIRGAVELGVRGQWTNRPEPAVTAPASGTDYMRTRLNDRRRADAVAAQLRQQLGARARAVRVRVLPAPSVPVSAAFLIDRGGEPGFVTAVGALAAELAETDLVCTGPWPAYSFVEADG